MSISYICDALINTLIYKKNVNVSNAQLYWILNLWIHQIKTYVFNSKESVNKMINTQTHHHNYCQGVAKVADKHLK